MSTTQQETLLHKEANQLSQTLYDCPFDELDEKSQTFVLQVARSFLRDKCADVEPGHCFQCGKKLLREESSECRNCHDPIDRVGQYYFNNRWEPII